MLFCLICVSSGLSLKVEEGDEEKEETAEDFSTGVTENVKEKLEGMTLVHRMVVEKHLKICHCKNYPGILKMILSCPHC